MVATATKTGIDRFADQTERYEAVKLESTFETEIRPFISYQAYLQD